MDELIKSNTNTQQTKNKPSKPKSKPIINEFIPTLEDVKRLALIRFRSYVGIGRAFGGYTKSYAFRVLNGQQIIKKDQTIQKIADALGIPSDTLRRVLPKDINIQTD